jgi:hypothetical protein
VKTIATADSWRAAIRTARRKKAQPLTLPSGVTVLAVLPDPLHWILNGRLPQRLLTAALGQSIPESDMTREDLLELSRFAVELVTTCVVEPEIGDGPGRMPLTEIPIEDRTFIFEWATRSLAEEGTTSRAQRLEQFRHQPKFSAVGVDGGEIRTTPEPTGGN